MGKVWSWEEEDYVGEDEPRAYPVVVAQACDICGLPHTDTNPVVFACEACGNATHVACGSDTEPSGGYDRDPDENYWLCLVCLADCEAADNDRLIDPTQGKALAVPGDVDLLEEEYELP